MKNKMNHEIVHASQISLSVDGPMLIDVTNTIEAQLNKPQLASYSRAVEKVCMGKKLNVGDLDVFDLVDDVTMACHGLCLKDSLVTKARIKACKRYGRDFVDRDGLIQHMELMVNAELPEYKFTCESYIADRFIKVVGYECAENFWQAIRKAYADIQLSKTDLVTFAKMENAADEIMGGAIVDVRVCAAIEKACKYFGVDFAELRRSVLPVHAH